MVHTVTRTTEARWNLVDAPSTYFDHSFVRAYTAPDTSTTVGSVCRRSFRRNGAPHTRALACTASVNESRRQGAQRYIASTVVDHISIQASLRILAACFLTYMYDDRLI